MSSSGAPRASMRRPKAWKSALVWGRKDTSKSRFESGESKRGHISVPRAESKRGQPGVNLHRPTSEMERGPAVQKFDRWMLPELTSK